MFADKPTSITLLQRLCNHPDEEAWRRVYHLYTPLVEHWCIHWGVSRPDVDDVRQEVFRALTTGMSSFRLDQPGSTFRGWLRGITRHKVLDHFRNRNRQSEGEGGTDAQRRMLQVPDPAAVSDDEPDQVAGLYHRALELVRGEFEERTWTAFWRSTIDGIAPAVIAADLGVSPAAVRQAKSRILRRLRQEVGDLIQ